MNIPGLIRAGIGAAFTVLAWVILQVGLNNPFWTSLAAVFFLGVWTITAMRCTETPAQPSTVRARTQK
jgi:hypothetical protein